jgi:hypothetical protein
VVLDGGASVAARSALDALPAEERRCVGGDSKLQPFGCRRAFHDDARQVWDGEVDTMDRVASDEWLIGAVHVRISLHDQDGLAERQRVVRAFDGAHGHECVTRENARAENVTGVLHPGATPAAFGAGTEPGADTLGPAKAPFDTKTSHGAALQRVRDAANNRPRT